MTINKHRVYKTINFNCNFYILWFFIIGFVCGILYWQVFFRIHCTSTPSLIPTIRLKYSFYEHFQYRTIKTCQNKNSNLFLTIAIISSYERLLIYLPSIFNTWILKTTNEIEIIIFIEEKFFDKEKFFEKIFFQLNKNQQIKSCVFIIKLKYTENIYPPQKKSFYAMKFLYTFYQERTSWILRLDDNAYVNIEKLIQWLKSIDYKQALYIGQSGSGRRNESNIHFPPGRYFCMSGSGVILSQRTLMEVGPWLDRCLNNEILTKYEDVELGRCILKHVYISCSNAYNSKYLFYHHHGPQYSFGYDFTPSIISQALIIHPIKNQNTFKEIFAFYLRQKQRYFKNDLSFKILRNINNYVTFLPKIEFDLIRDVHYQSIDARWKLYIEQVVQSYIEKTRISWHQQSFNRTLINGKFLFGYHRVTPSYGLELIVEILLNTRSISMSTSRLVNSRKRFYIRQTFVNKHHFNYREITNIKINEKIHQLNLIVVSSNKDIALKRFVKNFEHEVLNNSFRHKYFTLTILYFSQKNQTNNLIINFIRQLSRRYTSIIRISIIDQKYTSYNRGLGRHLASKLFSNNQLLFFLDVDLVFTGQALDNTRRLMIHQLSISSCSVYFPIIFSFFSNMFINNNNNSSNIIKINSKNGYFSIYGFGNVAVRKNDLDKIGGWETDNHDWGMEDVNLFQRLSNISSECYVFRAVEPGLRHNYHKKMCNGIMNIARQKMCHDADVILLASQADMVNYLSKKKNFNY